MGANYKHFTEQDRIFLRIMLEKRYPKSKIASILKVNPSTIYREIKRNSITIVVENTIGITQLKKSILKGVKKV